MFTEEDLERPGHFKKELEGELAKVMQSKGEVYRYYLDVVEDMGVNASTDLADLLVRAISDDQLASDILSTDVELKKVKMSEKREDDLEYVLDMKERLGIGENGSNGALDVNQLVKERLERVQGSPLDGVNDMMDEMPGKGEEIEMQLKQMNRRMNELESELTRTEGGVKQSDETPVEREERVDGLFEEEVVEQTVDEEDPGGSEGPPLSPSDASEDRNKGDDNE